MRMIYIHRDSRVSVLRVSSAKTIIEKDGYHKIPGNCIYKDASGREDAVCVMFQGRVLPYGDEQTKDSLEQMNYEIIATHYLGGKLDVDSAWGRFFNWLKDAGVTILLALIGLSVLIGAINGGM